MVIGMGVSILIARRGQRQCPLHHLWTCPVALLDESYLANASVHTPYFTGKQMHRLIHEKYCRMGICDAIREFAR
jgi:hypothetical protein